MENKTRLAAGVLLLFLGVGTAYSLGVDRLNARLQQDQARYKQDQQALQPIDARINALSQQINSAEQPILARYQGLDQKLQEINKPYQDKINQLYAEMRQAQEPYIRQIRQRDEELRRVQEKTRSLREEVRHLIDASMERRRALNEEARQIQRDSAELQNYDRANQNKPAASLSHGNTQPANTSQQKAGQKAEQVIQNKTQSVTTPAATKTQ